MAEKKDPAPLTAGDVQKLIDAALQENAVNYGGKLDEFGEAQAKLLADALGERDKSNAEQFEAMAKQLNDRFAEHEAVADRERKAWAEGLEKLGEEQQARFFEKFDEMLAGAEQRKAAGAAETEKAAAAERAEAEAARVKNDQAAAKRAEKQARADADALAKKIDRAVRDYGSLIVQPVPSGLALDAAKSIRLRFGDGATFHPEHHLELGADDLNDELGRLVNTKVIDLPAEAVPFTASEALLIVEGGKEPTAIYRSPIESPLRFGGGSTAQLATGALAFRRLSPVPGAAAA